jgi:hypothetical protein
MPLFTNAYIGDQEPAAPAELTPAQWELIRRNNFRSDVRSAIVGGLWLFTLSTIPIYIILAIVIYTR